MQEFAEDAPPAFRGTIIIDWVDSAQLMETRAAEQDHRRERSLVYQAVLKAYITVRQRAGFQLVLLNACTPQGCGVRLLRPLCSCTCVLCSMHVPQHVRCPAILTASSACR